MILLSDDSSGGGGGNVAGSVTHPFVTQTYRCVAAYETKDTKNRPFKTAVDEKLDVLIKDPAGQCCRFSCSVASRRVQKPLHTLCCDAESVMFLFPLCRLVAGGERG